MPDTDTRIQPLQPPYPADIAERFARILPPTIAPPAVYRTVAVNKQLFLDMVDMGLLGAGGLLNRCCLPDRIRELIILRTCYKTGNRYEWHLHKQLVSARMGLSEQEILATWSEVYDGIGWTPAEQSVLDFVDSLVARYKLSDVHFEQMQRHFDDAAMVEMTILIGQYVGVALLVEVARPALDEYAVQTHPPGTPDNRLTLPPE